MGSEFAGKLALVTGGGRGIGRSVAIALATQGASVVVTDLDGERVEQLAASLRADGLHCEGRKLDVGDADAVEMLVDELELQQPIDLLANVAGALDESDESWRSTFRLNTDGVFHVSRSVSQRMKMRGRGAIVIVGASTPRVPRMQAAAYAASRAAAHMFAKCLAHELEEHHVHCSLVAQGAPDAAAPRDLGMRAIRSPDDVAEAVVVLLSERTPVTLHELVVDGACLHA